MDAIQCSSAKCHTCNCLYAVDEGLRGWNVLQSVVWLIDSATYVFAHHDRFASYRNVAMSLYDINSTLSCPTSGFTDIGTAGWWLQPVQHTYIYIPTALPIALPTPCHTHVRMYVISFAYILNYLRNSWNKVQKSRETANDVPHHTLPALYDKDRERWGVRVRWDVDQGRGGVNWGMRMYGRGGEVSSGIG